MIRICAAAVAAMMFALPVSIDPVKGGLTGVTLTKAYAQKRKKTKSRQNSRLCIAARKCREEGNWNTCMAVKGFQGARGTADHCR